MVQVRMTLTAPACPAASSLPIEVHERIAQIPEVKDVKLKSFGNHHGRRR